METSIANKDYVANILVLTYFFISSIFKEKITKGAQILHCFSLVWINGKFEIWTAEIFKTLQFSWDAPTWFFGPFFPLIIPGLISHCKQFPPKMVDVCVHSEVSTQEWDIPIPSPKPQSNFIQRNLGYKSQIKKTQRESIAFANTWGSPTPHLS